MIGIGRALTLTADLGLWTFTIGAIQKHPGLGAEKQKHGSLIVQSSGLIKARKGFAVRVLVEVSFQANTRD